MTLSPNDTSRAVQSLYDDYPFPGPDAEYTVRATKDIVAYLLKRGAFAKGKKARILDAGCGTGGTAIVFARVSPLAQVIGCDFSAAALECAERHRRDLGLDNLEFVQADLETFSSPESFDLIVASGVIHHVQRPVDVLKNLGAQLGDEGRIVLWLYSAHGRARLHANQQCLSALLHAVPDRKQRVELAKRFIAESSPEHVRCYFSTANGAIDGNWDKSLEWILKRDAWVADQFLHPNENAYTMRRVLEELDHAGLAFDGWLGGPRFPRELSENQRWGSLIERLSPEERLIALDDLFKPNSYTIAAKRQPT